METLLAGQQTWRAGLKSRDKASCKRSYVVSSVKAGRFKVPKHTLPKTTILILPKHVSNVHNADYNVTQELVYWSTFSKVVLHCTTSYNPLRREAQMNFTCIMAFKLYQLYKRFLFLPLFFYLRSLNPRLPSPLDLSSYLTRFNNGLNRDLPFPWTNLNT